MKVIYLTTTGDNTLELPTPLDVEGYLCGIVEIAGKVVNLKGDLFLCCDFCEESVVGEIKLPVLRCIKRKQTGIVYNDINHVIWLQVIRPNISSIRLYMNLPLILPRKSCNRRNFGNKNISTLQICLIF